MKIFHIMKKGNQDTQFRSILLKALNWIHTNHLQEKAVVYLTSGFFDENVKSPRTPISTFLDKTTQFDLQSMLAGLTVELFGAYNGKKGLVYFGTAIKNRVSSIKAFYKYRFHAKLFAIEIDGRAVFEIIGSSNMTVAAYEGLCYTNAGNSKASQNYECDLVLLDEDINIDIKPNENTMVFRYNDEDNGGIPLDNRANEILQYIKSLKNEMQDISSKL